MQLGFELWNMVHAVILGRSECVWHPHCYRLNSSSHQRTILTQYLMSKSGQQWVSWEEQNKTNILLSTASYLPAVMPQWLPHPEMVSVWERELGGLFFFFFPCQKSSGARLSSKLYIYLDQSPSSCFRFTNMQDRLDPRTVKIPEDCFSGTPSHQL